MGTPAPIRADEVARWRPFIEEASNRFGVPVAWIERVMKTESAGRTRLGGRPIVSSAGAMGLMQLMPRTWADMRAKLGLGADPHEPRDNILAGTAYLRLMYDQFGYPGLFGAYNAGPGRYAEYLSGGRSLPGETRSYMAATAGSRPSRFVGGSQAIGVVTVEGEARRAGTSPVGIFFDLSASPRASRQDGIFVRPQP
ncbi:lytic transglycosylase domain-containing protein [Novosphingobium sp. JCM 18896]|uniref:lytic transglycosylase domain-containing protein n=1 Tax=Novosphingobium sp. JCM 18896 TaxID=2989731 RepID=UPI002221EC62|nr:lytic transglycosylase domain-containing protein [Novosphingobium sp. JCM 18896]MCW1430880.1 lytic transglycosylase domain-containing protein [Novosphingobium sp. JCM 18896]